VINKKILKDIGFLDWAIFISIVIMSLMIFLPQIIWEEEDFYKNIRRDKMYIISKAEDFYYQLTGEYTLNTNELFTLVEAATDSVIADSLFLGKQTINLNNKIYNVTVEPGFHIEVDTTFSSLEIIRYDVVDTIYTISMLNQETNLLDTMLVNSRSMRRYKQNELFREIINYTMEDRVEKKSNYLRRKFHLSNDLIYCPISEYNLEKKFVLSIEKDKNNDSVFKITSPLTKEDKELRYGIFSFNPGKEESILGGVKSWAEK
tara:strand:- start:670 stop:1452 length:783 start_codon:yes stop_codon:yes gene_type:complete